MRGQHQEIQGSLVKKKTEMHLKSKTAIHQESSSNTLDVCEARKAVKPPFWLFFTELVLAACMRNQFVCMHEGCTVHACYTDLLGVHWL